ncbi:protein PTST, chloroplastic-like [Coffea eugenioides]|uniref:protein PTST, chloroplastic-like n=1 Tax=Coffea eugenioides TaxID=49369 RepID=UPI000F611E3C|nr:protein PTST, chloroplastic-like [Coffea eugenioides]
MMRLLLQILRNNSSLKSELNGGTKASALPKLFSRWLHAPTQPPSFGIAFDIDGVLLRGETSTGGSPQALRRLYYHSANSCSISALKVPYVFLTNGGGVPESERAKELSKQLGVDILPLQVIQGHTPFRELVKSAKVYVFLYQLKALLLDSERSKIIKKLSDANQYNRVLKRQLQSKEDSLVNFKSELAVLELEIQALVSLAEEIANYEIPEGSRKIRGRYIQSHLLSRLEAVQEKLREQTKDVDAAQSKEVPLYWYGVAESVQVMGSFDGWSQGEHLSPEYTGSYTKFSTTLMLRPGRYEIKFLVDGEWNLSPEFPTIGEGLMQNNLLIVE